MPYIAAAFKQFTLTPGIPFDYPFVYYRGVPTTTLPVDLTGASATMVIFDGQNNTLLTLNSTATYPASGVYLGGQSANYKSGLIDIVISQTDTSAITWRYANYSLNLTTTAFGLQKILYGTFVTTNFLP